MSSHEEGIEKEPPSMSQSWSGGIDVLRNAGQSLWNSGAEIADKSRQLVGTTFGVVTLEAANTNVPPSKLIEVATPAYLLSGKTPSHRPKISAYYDENQIILFIDLPGQEKGDVNLTIEDDVLSISGTVDLPPITPKADVLISERTVGDYQRCFKLPPNCLQSEIDAIVESGLMQIKIKCV